MRLIARLFSSFTFLTLFGAALLMWMGPRHPPLPDLPPEAALTGPVERIVIEKAARRLTLLQGGQPVRIWPIALGFTPAGDKSREGDGRTPEGAFRINRRNDASLYHLSLGLDYPHPDDIAAATAAGYSPGGDIMIHGQPNALAEPLALAGDWTAGCIALTNAQMRAIWDHTPIGTPVEIRP
ncbi:MAG: L,D-transpeptidase [Paracoccaceae bacterium]